MKKLLVIASIILLLMLALIPGLASAQGLCEYDLFEGLGPGRHLFDIDSGEIGLNGFPVRQQLTVVLRIDHDFPTCPIPLFIALIEYEDADLSESLTPGDTIISIEFAVPPLLP